MRRHVLLYGLLCGLLIALLQFIEYRWLVIEHSIQIYGGLLAAIFAGLGIWLGLRLTRHKEVVREVVTEREVVRDVVREVVKETVVVREVEVPVPASTPFARDERRVESLGLTPRELEILELIAAGLSNREIAERVHVSENTVKTHSGRVFDKLGAKRRTQAVQLGKEFRLIP